jgi:hypothetical protein
MRASVRRFLSPDVDLEDFRPEDPEKFMFLLQVLVGPVDSIGEESLQFIVVSLGALRELVAADGAVLGRSLVVVDGARMDRILGFVRSAIERMEAPTWAELGRRLARLGVYEWA